jgi:hypothetical protein
MTKKQKEIIAYLHAADAELRKAMVIAGNLKMIRVTESIAESQVDLDDAITHAEVGYRKKDEKGVDK